MSNRQSLQDRSVPDYPIGGTWLGGSELILIGLYPVSKTGLSGRTGTRESGMLEATSLMSLHSLHR